LKYTITETPIIGPFLRCIAPFILKIMGWKQGAGPPNLKQYIVICAPHTSNMDAVLIMLYVLTFVINKKIAWLGKKRLFKWPLKTIMTWMGGVPVDRSKSENMVDKAADLFRKHEYVYLMVLPEGSRFKTEHWKSGFYYIAKKARVPIACIWGDYKEKKAGFGPIIDATKKSIDEVFEILKDFYGNISARYPDRVGPIRRKKE
jgi:1-acyl-sn-glycerol-3-phosphate acyltransferase